MKVRLGRAAVAAAVIWSVVPLVALAYHTIHHGGVLSGSDGALAGADQLFYMDSVRQSATHVLIADNFDLSIGGHVFLSPLYLLAGLLWLAGLPLQVSFWALQVLAAVALALAVVALVEMSLPSLSQRVAAACLGLFYLSPLVPLLAWTGAISPFERFELNFPAGESMPAWQLWGYPHAAIAVGLETFALIGVVRLASEGRLTSRTTLVAVSAAAGLTAWLHPWQGAIFIAVAAVLAARARSLSVVRALALPVAAAAAPIAYQRVLVAVDHAWRLDSAQNAVGQGPVWMLLVALAPLALLAPAGYRALAPGPLRTALAAWPAAAIVVYFATSQFPYHALEGISIPLGVLGVAGWARVTRIVASRSRRTVAPRFLRAIPGAVAVIIAGGAGISYEVGTFRDSERSRIAPYWLTAGDNRALEYLDRSGLSGGVFARYYLGMAVPAFTGRRTWVGEWTWTPDFARRQVLADRLMRGELTAVQAQALIGSSGARFVLRDCGAAGHVGALLGPMIIAVHRFGCAAVYQVRAPRPSGSRATRSPSALAQFGREMPAG